MLTPNQKLAFLQKSTLIQDDDSDPGGRIYLDNQGNVYHSVTRILSATAAPEKKKALDNWLARPGSAVDRDTAARRGTAAHASAEYLLKTAKRLATYSANKKKGWKENDQGLERPYSAITRWAINRAMAGVPVAPWGVQGYARGLTNWINENVTAIYGCEFSTQHPGGWAGTCDALLGVGGSNPGDLQIVDWKTSASRNPDKSKHDYFCQMAAYSLGLKHMTGLEAAGACIVLARRSGAPIEWRLDRKQLTEYEEIFQERAFDYFSQLLKADPNPDAAQAA